ncbi:MAG: hypothetical protein O9353_12365 [Bacteroidia bacterium]|nr:hypothetical protein [Bacteroidia bacterium]
MKRTILIPTDFSIESLIPVKQAAQLSSYDTIEIVLMFCDLLPGSITDLLFYTPAKVIEKYSNKEFEEACSIIRNKYASKISHMRTEVFHGTSDAAFDNFISGNKIDEVIFPKNYVLREHRNGFSPLSYIKNSYLPCREVEWTISNPHETASLSTLFMEGMHVQTHKLIDYASQK